MKTASLSRWSAGVWVFAWILLFLLQFALSRTGSDASGVTAAFQAVIVVVPLGALLGLVRRTPISQWHRGRVFWFLGYLLAFSLAINHLHALRILSAGVMPGWMSAAAYWIGAVLVRIVVPVTVLAVLLAWAATRHAWHLFDGAAVLSGGVVLLFVCFLSSAGHPFDRANRLFGDIWLSLTCGVFPGALVIVPGILWTRSKLKSRGH